MEKHYTVAELSKLIDIPESTVRYYRDKFPQYFPCSGEGRKRRYSSQIADVLRIIAEESKRSSSAEDIENRLSIEFSAIYEVKEDNAVNTAVQQQQLNLTVFGVIKDISSNLETIVNKLTAVEKQNEIIVEQHNKIEHLESEIKAIRELLQNTEQQQKRKNVVEKRSFFNFLKWNKTTVN
jgi:DNA-binding transcriptional MerR regulator